MIIDLNYRLDLPDGDVRSILGSDQWGGRFETLLRYDQVRFVRLTRDEPPTYPTFSAQKGYAYWESIRELP
jgi:hypothetical protein